MLRRAEKAQVAEILDYLRQDVGNCIYMYIDIAKYGLDNENISVWYDTKDDEIDLVVMKYYDSIQVYSRTENWKVDEVIDLVREEHTPMVSGQSWIIDRFYREFEDDYDLEVGYVFKLTAFREFDSPVPIEDGRPEDMHEIAALICSNESIGGYYEIDNLANQLLERQQTGIGRNLVIRRDGKIVAHIATYAEFENLAVTAGLIAITDETNIPYGTLLESKLILDLLDEGFEVYTFVTEARRARFFKAMKCQEYGRYGKMTLK